MINKNGFNRSFFITVTALIVIEFTPLQPFKTFGFYCNDTKLSFKNEGETISSRLLLFVSFIIPYFVFLLVEWISKNDINSKNVSVKTWWLRSAHIWYLKYLHGLFSTILVVDLTKIIAGEPRPHFLDTCRPKEALNCTEGEFIQTFHCENPLVSQTKIFDSYKSFPSGHSSFGFYSAFFVGMYLTDNIKSKSLILLNFLHLMCLMWAVTCSVSRITDHRHHWWDVLCGTIIGISICWYFYVRQWKCKNNNKLDAHKMKPFQSNFMNSN